MDLEYSRAHPTMAKRLWNALRVTFFMIRKGLVSKRRLIMDMNMMMKRGKLLRKTLTNLMFHHSHRHVAAAPRRYGYGIQEYEFSCSNSPSPVFFRALKRRQLPSRYFPCMNPPEVVEEAEDEDQWHNKRAGLNSLAMVPRTPEYYLRSPLAPSPFAVRVSTYSSEDEDNDGESEGRNGRVDDEAEEFIRRFYEQLRGQSRTQLLQYQED